MSQPVETEHEPQVENVDEEEPDSSDENNIGHLARWSVSSHKYGFGPENLYDRDPSTFWQSEGPQPHHIDLVFPRQVVVATVAFETNIDRDDSYTPSRLAILAGTSLHDLQEVRVVDLSLQPDGYQMIHLRPEQDEHNKVVPGPAIPCFHLRIQILANHQNGKDTHVRGIRVLAASKELVTEDPAKKPVNRKQLMTDGEALVNLGHDGMSGFTSVAFKQHERLR